MTTDVEAQAIIRSKGMCGALVKRKHEIDRSVMIETCVCILEPGHDNGVHAITWVCDGCGQVSDREHAPCACDLDCLNDLRALVKAERARAAHFEKRNEELRATLVRITQETPLPDEVKNALEQRGKLLAEVGTLRARIAELEAIGPHSQLDGVYRERNRLVAALACYANSRAKWDRAIWSACLGRHQPDPDPHWDPKWLNVVFIETPEGQLSWHIHDNDLALFVGIPQLPTTKWDGHDTDEKYDRLARLFR